MQVGWEVGGRFLCRGLGRDLDRRTPGLFFAFMGSPLLRARHNTFTGTPGNKARPISGGFEIGTDSIDLWHKCTFFVWHCQDNISALLLNGACVSLY